MFYLNTISNYEYLKLAKFILKSFPKIKYLNDEHKIPLNYL